MVHPLPTHPRDDCDDGAIRCRCRGRGGIVFFRTFMVNLIQTILYSCFRLFHFCISALSAMRHFYFCLYFLLFGWIACFPLLVHSCFGEVVCGDRFSYAYAGSQFSDLILLLSAPLWMLLCNLLFLCVNLQILPIKLGLLVAWILSLS